MALPVESQGLFEKSHIPVHYCGIGKVNAAYLTTELIVKHKPKYVLNLGTAGSKKFKTHELVQVSCVVQRDMDLSPLGFPAGETPMDALGGKLDLSANISGLKKGICGTGDSFEVGESRVACDLVDMEAYAIAKVCRKLKVECISIKYITDGSDDTAHKDWSENLKPAAEKLLSVYQFLMKA
jgi:adenosylhomocysteine nucleosidase